MNRKRRYKRQQRQNRKRVLKYIYGSLFTLLTIIIGITAKGTYAYFMQQEINYKVSNLVVNYEKDEIDDYANYSEGVSSLYQLQKGDVVFHVLNEKGDGRYSNAPFLYIQVSSPSVKDIASTSSTRKLNIEDPKYMWYKCVAKNSEIGTGTYVKVQIYKYTTFSDSYGSTDLSSEMYVDKNKINHYFITINSDGSLSIATTSTKYDNEIMEKNKVFRSFYLYYYSSTQLSNPSVTAVDAVGDVKKTRNLRQLTAEECQENGLTDTLYWYVTVGDDSKTKAEIELGIKSKTVTSLIFKDGSNKIETVLDVECSKEKGGKVFIRKGLYSEKTLNAVQKSLVVHYFDSTEDEISITPTISTIAPSVPESGSFDVGQVLNKWRTTDTFVWHTDKGFIDKEVLNFSINDGNKDYTYSSTSDDTELWIKEGKIFDNEPPDKANFIIVLTNSTICGFTTLNGTANYSINNQWKNTSDLGKVNNYWTFTGEYQIPTSFEDSTIIFTYRVSNNGNYGCDNVTIPYPITTSEVTYQYPNGTGVVWPNNNVNNSDYIKVKRDDKNNITITTNVQNYN